MSNHELENKLRELRQLQALIEEAETEADALKDAIKAHMGESEELRAGEYKVTWKPIKSARLDSAALNKALPAIYQAFVKTTTTRRFSVV